MVNIGHITSGLEYAEIIDSHLTLDLGGIGRAYNSWHNARSRCLISSNKDFPEWGGRGIKFCLRWLSFENFLNDMGPRPKQTTLDRIDVNGHYEHGNCRWASHSIQHSNKRISKGSTSCPRQQCNEDPQEKKEMPPCDLVAQDNLVCSPQYALIDDYSVLVDHGGIGRAYNSWQSAQYRCRVPYAKDFPKYGGRGIKFCKRWLFFDNFLKDMGPRPKNTTLDRIDVNGHYEPRNCRWATPTEQMRNRRCSVKLTYNGEEKHLNEWAEELNLSRTTIEQRLRRGYSEKDALEYSLHEGQKNKRKDFSCLEGQKFGHLTVKKVIDGEKESAYFARDLKLLCECVCGDTREYILQNIIRGLTKSCGCQGSGLVKSTDIKAGDVFGEWTVLGNYYKKGTDGFNHSFCLCGCSCGIEKEVSAYTLRNGTSTSCGHDMSLTHGACSKNSKLYAEYQAWESMKGRCYTPSAAGYGSNGKKGIQVCQRWFNSFENFLADMGLKPNGTMLCRKDNSGDYSPDNCFWGTKQNLPPNSRARLVTHHGETLSLTAWSKKLGIHVNTLRKRLDKHNTLQP
ncbi:MAG: hypothetical protein PHS86_05100 [Syntrophaceae bacterium]|nr:hypothetical protein [Syntrophaceae bacterium]